MILTGDYHTHTPYSHGKNTVDENVARAKEIGLKQIGISDHGYSHLAFGLRRKETQAYVAECKAAAKKYGIDVLVGMESNILGVRGKADLKKKDFENFDLYLAGHHTAIWHDTVTDFFLYCGGNFFMGKVFKNNPKWLIKRNTKAYINAIKSNPLDAITHINFVCACDCLEVAKCAADYGTYLELNSKKTHISDEQLAEILAKTQVRFIINSDAHHVSRIGDTKLVEEQLARVNFPMDRIDNIDGRYPNFRFAEFKKHL